MILIGEGGALSLTGLVEMIAVARRAGDQVVMLTNGTLLEPRLAAEFIRAGLDELRVSLWASDAEEIRCPEPGVRPEMFHRALEGVRSVAAARRQRQSALPWIVVRRPSTRGSLCAVSRGL